ncbi:hypothetical protein ACFL1R_09415 [Candidatus Latescibacterota bacterium]
MKSRAWFAAVVFICANTDAATELHIPYGTINAPVVHSGGSHILSCGETYVVLDSARGMSITIVAQGQLSLEGADKQYAVMTDVHLGAAITSDERLLDIDQTHDRSARLEIIDQGPGRTAARAHFSLCSADGFPHGSGTMDIYVYDGRVNLVPSIFIDDKKGGTSIIKAGLYADIPGKNAEMIMKGSKIIPTGEERFVPFGEDTASFDIMINNPGRSAMKVGWLRNSYPEWIYLLDISINPEVDELYEKWPLWITQRGPIKWTQSSKSGFIAGFSNQSLENMEFLWVRQDSLEIPAGGYSVLNGVITLFLASTSSKAQNMWEDYQKPVKPSVTASDFRYFNEIEGVYEIDSGGGDVDIVFDNFTASFPRNMFVRIWNLAGNGGYEINADNNSVPFALLNDGDIIEDPMVSVVKSATGPARFATAALTVGKGSRIRLTMIRKTGIQFTYQMYSELETYEAWSDACEDTPLFRFHVKRGALYHATVPGNEEYAFFKLPCYWLKNGVNQNTFMNHLRGFTVHANSPEYLSFTYSGANLQGTGFSKYTVNVPYETQRLTLNVDAEFTPLDTGVQWTSIEYCDLYPFEHVYRRDFHYDDVIYLDRDGMFDKVGTGAWSNRFDSVEEPERLGYHAELVEREGPGSRTPDSTDGTVWILADNPQRGNILYRRGDWTPSPGAASSFSLCNAWVDIHNTVVNRQNTSAGEKISYTVELFNGSVPSLDDLNTMYQKAAGRKTVKQVNKVMYSLDGVITGFLVE